MLKVINHSISLYVKFEMGSLNRAFILMITNMYQSFVTPMRMRRGTSLIDVFIQ